MIRLMALMSFGFLIQYFSVGYANEKVRQMTPEEIAGKNYFEGNKRFENKGVACISCHSVYNEHVANGGLLAKNLTDVYSRMGEGISAWLMAPPFPAMDVSYKNHPLTEAERMSLQAFFKYADEVKETQNIEKGHDTMLYSGIGGVVVILFLISIIWMNRKRKMVKDDIFTRQLSAEDAKH